MAQAPGQLAFTFPGQGSYSGELLRDLFTGRSRNVEFSQADLACQKILGHPFLPLVEAPNAAEREEALKDCPELDQVAIYLTNYTIASELIRHGVQPDLLLGHSFGELAALAVAGVYSFETGARIVCQRSAALRQFAAAGGAMAAAHCGADAAGDMIRQIGRSSLEIAVINHARQVVISGLVPHLTKLGDVMARHGIGLTMLKSRHPFHSSLLRSAVEPFRLMLCSYSLQPAAIPVYLCTEGRLHGAGVDLTRALSDQFIKRLDFATILRDLQGRGFHRFVECGAGDIVTRIIQQSGLERISAYATAHPPSARAESFLKISQEFAAVPPRPAHPRGDVAQLAREMRDLLARASRVLESLPDDDAPTQASASTADSGSAGRSGLATGEPLEDPAFEVEVCEAEPVAIVSMGCVLPGASNPEEYWNNILKGVSGIADLRIQDPHAAADFLAAGEAAEPKVVPDKTYTLLSGTAGTIRYDAGLLAGSYSEADFNRLTRGERLLALATAQALRDLQPKVEAVSGQRIECVLGGTADGSGEYDYALFRAGIEELVARVEPDRVLRDGFISCLKRVLEESGQNTPVSQSRSCERVIRTCLGQPVHTYVIDAACSSSLYAVALGVTALQHHARDLMLVGGVFSPGPANSALFAQFRGLSPTGSRPLDAKADGVIFGEGAGILVLKRLSDAIAAGDRVWGVIRAVGISSDGKSPAINVPQSRGQSIAIRRAYETSRLDVNSIQYVEAHATATPVGDAVEFEALRQAISRDPSLPRIELGSVKALIGHTGWAAGAASVIKLCKAFEKRTVPPQFNYSSPNPGIALNDSPFQISTAAAAWTPNIRSLPRRAAINGFGFGGTNAHLILEEFHPAYHRNLCAGIAPKPSRTAALAVVDFTSLFPGENALESTRPTTERSFQRSALRLPKGKRLLPDVTDHMDPAQFLAALAAERVLPSLGDRLNDLRGSMGVVIGVESKTERGVRSSQRIFLDRLRRLVTEDRHAAGLGPADKSAILEKISTAVRKEVIASGPYTLPGLMPNVIAGRVSNLFELNGPNVVIDEADNSLFQSILVARDLLAHGDCSIVLTGGVNAMRLNREDAEAAFLMLLTTEETARRLKLPVACLLGVDHARAAPRPPATAGAPCYRGADGAIELAAALSAARDLKKEAVVSGRGGETAPVSSLVFRPLTSAEPASPPAGVAPVSGTYSYVQGTPIYCYTPVQVPVLMPAAAHTRGGRRILFLTEQPEQWRELEESGALDGFDYQVLCTRSGGAAKMIPIDVAREETATPVLQTLGMAFDTIVPVKFLAQTAADSLLAAGADELQLLDLMFHVCRHFYPALQAGKMSMGSLCLGAFSGGSLHPATGLISGFVKSLARELPSTLFRVVNIAETDFRRAIALVDAELSHAGRAVEVCYRHGERFELQLARVDRFSHGENVALDANSVVLATGGGRGVTAVLAEELLTRFGCTVIAAGRTDPTAAPAEILEMNAGQLAAFEQEFYRREMSKVGKRITQLRDQFRAYQASQEVFQNIRRLSALPGRYEYVSVDITEPEATTALVESVFRKYGRVDMVLHGAGIQVSKVLPKKTVDTFRSVVRAKLASLRHIYNVCEKRRDGQPIQYHLLTSAFSYMGNDGQADYGAANEALNRLAEAMTTADAGGHRRWCSVAWLGWAGIGMTRGSEFAALAASRGLRGITKSEGQEIFANFLTGKPTAAINILMADGELKFYNVATSAKAYEPEIQPARPARSRPDRLSIERTVTADGAPYVLNHRVDGVPTLPGAFLIMMIADAALQLRPDLKIVGFEDASFRRFVRLREGGSTTLRLNASVAGEDERSTVIRVQVVSDFTHKSGMVLQKDVVQTEMSVRMASSIDHVRAANGSHGLRGRMLHDPYVMEASPVHLNGPFRTLHNIVVGEGGRSAEYHPAEDIQSGGAYGAFLPNLLVMDSLWRFGAIDMDSRNSLPVYVPEACKVMKVYYDLTNTGLTPTLMGKLSMRGSNPKEDEGRLLIGPVEVRDADGSLLLMVDGGVCRKLGEVRNGHS